MTWPIAWSAFKRDLAAAGGWRGIARYLWAYALLNTFCLGVWLLGGGRGREKRGRDETRKRRNQ